MSSTFVCLSSLFTPAHWLSPDTKHHITNFMSVFVPSCSSKYHIPDSSLSLKNPLYLSYFPAPRQVLSVSLITCVPSFSPHPENNIWPSFSSLCTYCCSFLSSDTIVPRSDWTSDMVIGFTLKIQDFWDVTLYQLLNIYHSTWCNISEVLSLQQHHYKNSELGRFYFIYCIGNGGFIPEDKAVGGRTCPPTSILRPG